MTVERSTSGLVSLKAPRFALQMAVRKADTTTTSSSELLLAAEATAGSEALARALMRRAAAAMTFRPILMHPGNMHSTCMIRCR